MELQNKGYFTVEASEYFQISQNKLKKNYYTKTIPLDQITAYEIVEECGEKLHHAILSGIRTIGEYTYFCNLGIPVYLVAIISGTEMCYERALKRNREYIGTYEDFINNRINPDNQLGLNQLMLKANLILYNYGVSLEGFLKFGSTMLAPYINMD